MRDFLRTRLVFGFGAALLVLGVIVALTYGSTERYLESSRAATLSRIRLLMLEQVLSAARDVETGQRGFLITGEESYLEPYNTALANMAHVRARLDSLAVVPGVDRAAVATARRLLDRKLDELSETIETYRAHGPEAAGVIVKSEIGRRTMDSLRLVVGTLEAGQAAVMSAADADVRRAATRTLLTVSLLAALAFVLFGAVCLLLWRRVQEQTSELGRLNADLTERVAEVEALFAVVPIGLGFASDPECRDIRPNPSFARTLRLGGEENASKSGPESGRLPFRCVDYEGREIAPENLVMQRAARTGQAIHNEAYRVVFSDGAAIDMLGSAAPLFDEQGRVRGAVGAFVDVSERRRADERLQHAERLQAVGQLAGGVAHEINNLMTTVLGFAEFALRGVGSEHPAASDLRQVLAGGRRAADVAQQLLAFSRRQAAEPRVLVLDEAVLEAGPTLERLAGAGLRVELSTGSAGAHVRLDLGQLHQVLINLTANARDATPEHGTIAVRTAVADSRTGQDALSGLDLEPGRYAVLTVADSGSGMDPVARRRAFEPFFTTKGVGKGTGLGLSIVYGIVKQAGGDVRIASEPGRGTRVEVYLPVVPAPADAEASSVAPAPPSEPGERILLVEDDDTVRAMAARVLSEEGYVVTAVADGRAALDALAEAGGRVDLVVTDIIMPNLGGRRLRSIVAERYPRMPVLFMSGYSGEMLLDDGERDAPAFLAKPFTADQLLQRVREELDRAGRRRPASGQFDVMV
ncbi:MAG TPA: CHASE3 domain-containing protein [Gemmatimonadales bacterium]|nr:CHASE3 domain-containing protein [Gemmatimonadales bacterium]